MLWIWWFALFLPLYQIDGLVLFHGDRRCYGGGFGMGILRGGSMVVSGGQWWCWFTSDGGVQCNGGGVGLLGFPFLL